MFSIETFQTKLLFHNNHTALAQLAPITDLIRLAIADQIQNSPKKKYFGVPYQSRFIT